MSAVKKRPGQKRTTQRAGAIEPTELRQLRGEFDQILMASEDHERYGAMDNHELSKLAHESEIIAAKARYTLWRRFELNHQGN